MPINKKAFGAWGENQAETFLTKRRYKIISKNYQKRGGEIDIIAEKENILHFIEVKTRKESSVEKFGPPEEAVNNRKRKKIIETARIYLQENNIDQNINWQIDVVSIVCHLKEKKIKIKHIKNAFDENL